MSYLTILYAAIGSLGFSLFFHLGIRHVLPAVLDGVCGWIVFLLLYNEAACPLFVCALAAAVFVSVAAEFLARALKAPSTIYYTIAIVPLVPGSNLYYLIEALIRENGEAALQQLYALCWTMLGIGTGAAAVLGVLWTWRRAAGSVLARRSR